MHQQVTLDAELATPSRFSLELSERPDGGHEAKVDGQTLDVDLAPIAAGVVSVRVAGRIFDLVFDGRPPECRVAARGRVTTLKLEDERQKSRVRAHPAGSGEHTVRSPMPGRVVKVLVSVGERVEPGQGLVVLEAMKMENEVRARAAGVVAKIDVQAGASVESNTPLVTLTL